uniref:Uncharacterized protein n=1 Tax=Arundo donax TaxID=35708 RepID=A0A0A9EHC1_ARUDO
MSSQRPARMCSCASMQRRVTSGSATSGPASAQASSAVKRTTASIGSSSVVFTMVAILFFPSCEPELSPPERAREEEIGCGESRSGGVRTKP